MAGRTAALGLIGAVAGLADAGVQPVATLATVDAYRAVSALAYAPGSSAPVVVLRTMILDGRPRWLTVDADTLSTKLAAPADWRLEPRPWLEVQAVIARTTYGRALEDGRRNERALTDAGITHLRPEQRGVELTVDLCPSKRPLDRSMFTTLIAELGRVEHPVPVAVAVTGIWMREHPADLAWLAALDAAGRLAITWINHSFNHFSSRTRPLSSNFLLEPGTDIGREVLGTERALIERGLLPSVFFRFPGLVSSPELIEAVVSYGLVPIGSDAWLAKGQYPTHGSIVLIHANGNEPLGVKRFVQMLQKERGAVAQHHWLLLDLRESLVESDGAPRR